ncbi:MAG: ROK family transcriptional regulator [Anaerolineales bacterium]|nr:ROK family transcriptional regulator [Anaerolineales bacterium]
MADFRTADYSLMREMNVALILECLRRDAPLSRAQLAVMTGLNKTTVSSLVRELIAARYVREMGLNPADKGRPAIPLELDPAAGYILAAEIGVDFVSVILTNFAADVLWRQRVSTVGLSGQAVILERVVAAIRAASDRAAALDSQLRILGLGVGIPGLVDVVSGRLLFAPNLGWADVPVRQILEAEFDFPVWVDNEANMAALGESYFGAARGADFVLYVSAGVGLGGGVVLNRRILAGAAGLAGEVGHMTMDPAGPRCNCGNTGCWETYVSQWAVFQRVRQAVASGQHSALEATTGGALNLLTVPLVVEAAQRGDAVARKALEETGRYLGIGLANLINALNPQRVVLGGIMSLAHEFLWPSLEQVVRERALRWAREAAEIVLAAYGEDACVMGGIATVYHHALSQPRQPAGRLVRALAAAV